MTLFFTGALYHSEFISALDLQSLTKNASTFAYLIDVSEDSKLIGISDRATPTDGSDKSIMTKLVFGYPYITYGGKLGILNGRKCSTNLHLENRYVATNPGREL